MRSTIHNRYPHRHGIVSGNHNTAPLPPIDRPSGLRKENPALARSFRYRIPQPPAPRGRRDRACSQDSLSPYWANASWSFSFLSYRQLIGTLYRPARPQRGNTLATGPMWRSCPIRRCPRLKSTPGQHLAFQNTWHSRSCARNGKWKCRIRRRMMAGSSTAIIRLMQTASANSR